MKKFIDHETFTLSLLFNECCFNLNINVNERIADSIFLYPQLEIGMLRHKTKHSKISILLIDTKFFVSVEISGVGLVAANE